MERKFKLHFEALFQHTKQCTFLLAVSGGVDSVVMANLMRRCGYRFGIAHVNYALRAAESDADEQFVRQLADSLDVPCHVAQKPINPTDSGIQEKARDLRYAWFEELVDTYEYDAVLTAHHADDQLETLFMRLSRGSGLEGLGGIQDKNGLLMRPMLPFFKKELIAYATAKNLTWRTDTSNQNKKYLRNAIRHDVLPSFLALKPEVAANTLTSMQHLRDAFDALTVAEAQIKMHWTQEDKSIKIPIASMTKRTPLNFWLHHLFSPYGFDAKEVEKLLETHSGKKCISATHELLHARDYLVLAELKHGSKSEQAYFLVPENGISAPIKLEISEVDFATVPQRNVALLHKEKLDFPLVLRKWKAGDVFFPSGMTGKKKLAKFFKDEKMSAQEKEQQWLLCSGDEIVWVVGKRINRKFAAVVDTTTLQIKNL
jgi:tRNA(Ile)-lysidine synthase